MRTFYVTLHLEKPDEPLHGAHAARVRPEEVSRQPVPGLARSYVIEEDVYLSKEWQKTKLGEKHIKARDVGSRWERMNLPRANFLHHGNLWVFTDEATARKTFDGTSGDEWSRGKGVRKLMVVRAVTVLGAAQAALQGKGDVLATHSLSQTAAGHGRKSEIEISDRPHRLLNATS
jgi:hypothetical protein